MHFVTVTIAVLNSQMLFRSVVCVQQCEEYLYVRIDWKISKQPEDTFLFTLDGVVAGGIWGESGWHLDGVVAGGIWGES